MEEELLARCEKTPRSAPRRHTWVLPVLAAAAMAATAAAAVLRPSHPAEPEATVVPAAAPEAPRAPDVMDGDALAVGAVVTAEESPVVVSHADHVTWTLAPSSVAKVESTGDVIELSLDRGSVFARVKKSPRPESFAVRVERSRIAVHGTAFRVERLEKTVHIEAEEGVLAIGPVGGKAFELRAPGSANVSFEGERAELPRSTAARPAVPPVGAQAPVPEPKNAADSGAHSAATPPTSYAPNVDRVIQTVKRCLLDNTVAGGDLHVTVRTRMSLRVHATGHVGEAVFTPPLAPSVQACVDTKVGAVGFVATPAGFAIDRVIELER